MRKDLELGVPGNKDALALLEFYTERAREGNVSLAGIFTVEGNRFACDFQGEKRAFHIGFFAADHLLNKMRNYAYISADSFGDESAPANKWLYDLSLDPICHDIIVWLATVKMIMKKEGHPGPLMVSLFKRNDIHEFRTNRSMPNRDAFVQNVFLPAIKMFGAEVNDSIEGRNSHVYTPKLLCEWSRNGEEVPRINVPKEHLTKVAEFLKGRTPVTITLRETNVYEHRNSNVEEWCKFATWLKSKGEWVLFLRDTAKAKEPLPGFEVFSGTEDAFVRAALYEQSKCNCFVSNGPIGWGLFGTRPWLGFHTVTDTELSECNTPHFWGHYQGIAPGEQYPWSGPQQRMVYADDNFENMRAAWLEHMEINAKDVQLMGELLDAVG